MKVVIAPDSFKDSLSAEGVAQAIAEGLAQAGGTLAAQVKVARLLSRAPISAARSLPMCSRRSSIGTV